ncbi:MAG: TIGR00296 family protein [Candidatus Diapherotrites archaeon]
MAERLSFEEGKELVKLARKSISYMLATGLLFKEKTNEKKFLEKRGVFVTLNLHPGGELRGCIGLPYPVKPLWSAVIEAAVSAALHDPRFQPLKSKELEEITVEVSVLTEPKKADKSGLPDSIRIGEHGLIIEKGYNSGLLLPQVATELGWDAETFLEQVCLKAGLYAKAWKAPDATIKIFSAQIFSEEKPGGKISEKKI